MKQAPTPELLELIDRASQAAGSDYKLAQLIGQGRQRISNWRHGEVPCPPEDQALMAAIAGLDPVAELARATVRKHEGSKKGDLLMRALGKASPAIGAVLSSVGAAILVISGWITPTPTRATEAREIQCVLCQMAETPAPRDHGGFVPCSAPPRRHTCRPLT